MSDLAEWYADIRRQVKECPEPTMNDALIRSARNFCEQTLFVRRSVSFQTSTNDASYSLPTINSNEEIVVIRYVSGSDNQSAWVIDRSDPSTWNPDVSPGRPRLFYFIPYKSVSLFPTPDATYAIKATVASEPTLTATVLPDELDRQWRSAVAAGALAWIMEMPDEVWTNLALAELNWKRFRAGVNNARAQVIADFTPGPQRVRGRAFIV